jgi:hypothetical protein
MIDLSSFVGKFVVVQFRNQDVWITIHGDERGQANVAAVDLNDGKPPRMLPVPFIRGEVVDKGEECFVLQIRDENNKKLEIALNPEAILAITTVVDEKVLVRAS